MGQVAVDPTEDVVMTSASQSSAQDETKASTEVFAPSAKEEPVEIYKAPCESKFSVPLAGDQFIHGLAVVLSLWVQETASSGRPQQLSRFHSSQAPSISIHNYLKRLRKYFLCSDECFVHALVYIDRIGKNNDSMTVCNLTVHRLLSIATMIAAKFHDDTFYDNFYYGKACGMSLKEVNILEVVMLKELNWRTLLTVSDYQLYHDLVCQAMACA